MVVQQQFKAIRVDRSDDSKEMRVQGDSVGDLHIVVVRGRDVGHCGGTFRVCGRWCVASIIDSEDEMHVVGPLAPEGDLTHGIPPSLCMCRQIWSDSSMNN